MKKKMGPVRNWQATAGRQLAGDQRSPAGHGPARLWHEFYQKVWFLFLFFFWS
jgi:hypothetical protein